MSPLKQLLLLCLLVASGGSLLAQGATPPALSTPSNAVENPLGPEYYGALTGQASVSAGGNASYVLPIELPPGTRGMVPPVSINYNSNMRNGLLGLGWFLQGPTSQITRCPQTVSQDGLSHVVDYTSQDRFCLDGHRLVLESGDYGDSGAEYRTETDSFSRIISHGVAGTGPAYFTVETKDGMIKYYGNTPKSAIEAEGKSTIGIWALNRVEDAAGNYYAIDYYESTTAGEFYPTAINYTGNDSAGLIPNVSVQFLYESRPDKPIRYQGGSKISDHPKRLYRIKATVDSALVTEYRLTYQEKGVRPQSRLTQIERCDAQGQCQNPIVLQWWATNNGTTFTHYELTVPISGTGTLGNQVDPRWIDLNGDGTLDYVYTVGNGDFEVMLSGPGGYHTESWSGGYAGGTRTWADINGDGLTDIITRVSSNNTTYTFYASLSTGSGFDTQLWATYSHPQNWGYPSFAFKDMNGDKLLDLRVKRSRDKTIGPYPLFSDFGTAEDTRVDVYLNTGAGFSPKTEWASIDNKMVHLADMNGDGLTDVVENARYVRLNNGTGFDAAVLWLTTGTTGYGSATFSDFNGDGKADRRWTGDGIDEVHYNTGASFVIAETPVISSSVDFNGDGQGDGYFRYIYNYGENASDWDDANIYLYLVEDELGSQYDSIQLEYSEPGVNGFQQVADINGDGIYDYTVQRTENCGLMSVGAPPVTVDRTCQINKNRIYHTTGTHQHLLKKIITGQGAEITFTYAPLTDHSIYTKYDTSTLPELDVQDGTQVVTKMEQPDGIGGSAVIEYTYEGLKRDLDGRGNLGFAKITAKNLQAGTTTITDYAQTFPYSSQPTRTEVQRSSDSQPLSLTDTTYGLHGVEGSGTVFPYVDTRETKTYDLGDGRLLSTSTTLNEVDLHGNITDSVVETVDHENGQTFKTRTLDTYTIDTLDWRIGQLTSRTVQAWLNGVRDATLDRRTDFTWDAGTGFLVDTIQEPGKGAGIELTKTLAYDNFGNVTSETLSGPGLASRVTTTSYDPRGQFPLTITNPLGHQTSRTWNTDFGTKESETDANGQTTYWDYNSFGQVLLEMHPGVILTISHVYEDNAGTLANAVLYSEVTGTGKAPVREFYDLLGRTLRTRTQAFDGRYVNQDTEYDSQGRVYRTSEPYFDGDPIDWNTNTYDFLGRVTAVDAADPVKSVTSSYDGFTVSVTDAQDRTKTQVLNAVGQIIQVIDELDTQMEFTYDPVGNRIQVTNAVGTARQNSVTYSYDRLGRMLSQNDPDHGIYTYTYDALGQKLSDTSPTMAAASQSATYQYDLLGRMTSRTEPEGTTTWVFDNTAGGNLGIGQLHRESSTGFMRTYTYGAGNYGRLTATSTQIDALSYNTAMTYNTQGQLTSETYPGSVGSPNGFQVEYTYNALGFQERVQAPGGGTVYYQLLATDAAGRTTSEWLGDGSIAIQAYETASSRVIDQHTVNGPTDIQHFSYTYDDAGNMTSRSDVRQGLSETFTFDDLDRLTGGQVTGGTLASYGFDVVGNITQKSDAGNPFGYTSPAVHAVTQITAGAITRTLSYDPNGNLSTGDDVPTITWSSYNKPVQLTKGTITYSFSYAPDRSRYKKVNAGETTYYIGSGFERINKPTSTEYRHVIRANGRAVMLRKASTSGTTSHQYIHRDHLGSITALTRENDGSVIQRYSYDAWGLRRSPNDWTSAAVTASEKRGYTGHEHLDDIGIIHMNGRVYDPKLGRMLSPDPVTQAPENGQNYNRYSYAYNNPLKYSDPSGFQATTSSSCLYAFTDPSGTSAGACVIETVVGSIVAGVVNNVVDKVIGSLFGNGCDRTCQDRQAALNWCKAQSACIAELRANTREKFRRRSAQVILEASQTGQSYYYENGRAHLGDNTTEGTPVGQNPVPGSYQNFQRLDQSKDLDAQKMLEIWRRNAPEGFVVPDIGGFADFDGKGGAYSVADRLLGRGITLDSEFRGSDLSREQLSRLFFAIGHEAVHHNQNVLIHAGQAVAGQLGVTHPSVDGEVQVMFWEIEGLQADFIEFFRSRE